MLYIIANFISFSSIIDDLTEPQHETSGIYI